MRFAIILPARNEEEAIGATLAEVRGCLPAEIVVADNGSNDRTAAVAAAEGARVVSEPRAGYGRACLAAIRALGPGIDIVVFMDADGSDDPAALARLLEPILRGRADLVIGSREPAGGERNQLPAHQRWGNRLAAWLTRRLYGVRYTDLGPFRAIRRESLELLGMSDPDYGWTMEMQVKAALAGLRVIEVPVDHRPRRAGKSKVSGTVRGSVFAGAKILWTVIRYRLAPPQFP